MEQPVNTLLSDLKERAKELNCIYEVKEITNNLEIEPDEVFQGVVNVIPPGWQYPDICVAQIIYGSAIYSSPDFKETKWFQKADIIVKEKMVGTVNVYYSKEMPTEDEGPFLKEERKLLNTIAGQLGSFLFHRELRMMFQKSGDIGTQKGEWRAIFDLLLQTDPQLLMRLARKITNFLCRKGDKDAEKLLEHFSQVYEGDNPQMLEDSNRPNVKKELKALYEINEKAFKIAVERYGEKETLGLVQKWIKEDKTSFLVNILENEGNTNTEINDALERFHHLDKENIELSEPRRVSFRVALIRRILTTQTEYINIAKNYVSIDDFYRLFGNTIYPANSHGKLGGKSAGMFLASQILKKSKEHEELFKNIKTPKTWFVTSDGILEFLRYNNLEDVIEQKYKDITQVRQEYPYILQLFKNSPFPPELVKGLMVALEDFGDSPLIVRSSSLLEDRFGTAFAGKYKSLFIANQGTKQERLTALLDAISEVYASTFSPDPIQYRAERGLLDFHEEMGIMIQEVVGTKIGHYFCPIFAGVAFSNNEFRWSPRIKPEDGLIRFVPGLGTRAVDRLSNDYPILLSPGQPGLKVNVTVEETIRYSPKNIDVINLKENSFVTIAFRDLVKEYGQVYPQIHNVVSILEHDRLNPAMAMHIDYENDDLVATFDGVLARTPFVRQMQTILKTLEDSLGFPVDIEFASDGENLYLLQCRPQSYGPESTPAKIPTDIPKDRILFTAEKYISNAVIQNITHLVYVNPAQYSELSTRKELVDVGHAISKLNKILPKRQFILMGPGRWGSRGDIKLGVSVTYSDINNAVMLVEIARKQGNYIPDLSFGTHFFQDLVEASIRYLPLYPDESSIIFNEDFFTKSKNLFTDLVPELSHLNTTIHVIDVKQITDGLVLNVLMNGNSNKAVGLLSKPKQVQESRFEKKKLKISSVPQDHSEWRMSMAEEIANQIDTKRFGVVALYIFGSAKNATAGTESDIDLLIHFKGTKQQKRDLLNWFEGWSLCLSELNYLRYGVKTEGLLDIHLVTDEDIKNKTSYAIKIDSITDPAYPLPTSY